MLKSALPEVFVRALDRLTDESERYWGLREPVVEPLALTDRESAHVLRARLRFAGASSDRYVFVKVFKPRGPLPEDRRFMRERVVKDFAVTTQVHDALRECADLSAVRPVACFPDDLILVTEEVPGESFDALLERRAIWQPDVATLDDLSHLAGRIGAWFSMFQRIKQLDGLITLDSMREYLDVRLKRLVSGRAGTLSAQQRRAVLAYFDARSREVEVTDLTEVLVHGDVAPSNIIVNGGRVIVIDFAMACTGGMYLDVARLFTQLEFLKAKPKFRPHVVARLQAALLSGFDPALRADHPLFQLFELQHVICHMANLSLNPARPVARLYNRYQLRRHQRWLRERAA
jgi:Phosphotransferase enzyme family